MRRNVVSSLVLGAVSLGLACELLGPAVADQRATDAVRSRVTAAKAEPNRSPAAVRGTVEAKNGLNIRALPTSNSAELGSYSRHARISILSLIHI